MAKKFTRIEPTTIMEVGDRFKRQSVVKRYRDSDGFEHEFTTYGKEGERAGAVIALTPDNQVIVTRQFRAGPEKWLDELPGGGIESGEDPQVGVMRELREETGYVPGEVKFLGEGIGHAYTNTHWWYYLATNCTPHSDGMAQDEEERLQGAHVHLISIDELIKNAQAASLTDPVAVLQAYEILQTLKRHV